MISIKSKGTVPVESTYEKSKLKMPRSEMTREALLWSNRQGIDKNCDVTNDFLNINIHGSNHDVTK